MSAQTTSASRPLDSLVVASSTSVDHVRDLDTTREYQILQRFQLLSNFLPPVFASKNNEPKKLKLENSAGAAVLHNFIHSRTCIADLVWFSCTHALLCIITVCFSGRAIIYRLMRCVSLRFVAFRCVAFASFSLLFTLFSLIAEQEDMSAAFART